MNLGVCALGAALSAVIAAGPPARAESNLLVQSDSDCPGGHAVTEALRTMRPGQDWAGFSATIHVGDDRMQVTLGQDPNNRREIPVSASCADRADRLAFVIAVWSSELPARPTGAPSLLVTIPAPEPPSIITSTFINEVGLSGFYSLVGSTAPGVAVEVGRFRRAGWWGVRAMAGYQSEKSLRVHIGAGLYDRALLGASWVLRWNGQRTFFSGDLGLLGAFTRVHGDGYSQNQSASGLNVALAADGRAGLRIGRFGIWLGLSLYRWARKETIQVDPLLAGAPSRSTLPAWDAHLGMGASLGFN